VCQCPVTGVPSSHAIFGWLTTGGKSDLGAENSNLPLTKNAMRDRSAPIPRYKLTISCAWHRDYIKLHLIWVAAHLALSLHRFGPVRPREDERQQRESCRSSKCNQQCVAVQAPHSRLDSRRKIMHCKDRFPQLLDELRRQS